MAHSHGDYFIGPVNPTPPNQKPSVGEEFIQWAEKGWALQEAYNAMDAASGSESAPYGYIRKCLVDKLNSIIKERVGL